MKAAEKTTFAINLIAIRKAKGISQRDLAKLTGISNRMIAYYETNAVIPPIDKLKIIAEALKVSIASLLDSEASDKNTVKINTRTLKKALSLEELPPEDQRKVQDYINALKAKNNIKKPS